MLEDLTVTVREQRIMIKVRLKANAREKETSKRPGGEEWKAGIMACYLHKP